MMRYKLPTLIIACVSFAAGCSLNGVNSASNTLRPFPSSTTPITPVIPVKPFVPVAPTGTPTSACNCSDNRPWPIKASGSQPYVDNSNQPCCQAGCINGSWEGNGAGWNDWAKKNGCKADPNNSDQFMTFDNNGNAILTCNGDYQDSCVQYRQKDGNGNYSQGSDPASNLCARDTGPFFNQCKTSDVKNDGCSSMWCVTRACANGTGVAHGPGCKYPL